MSADVLICVFERLIISGSSIIAVRSQVGNSQIHTFTIIPIEHIRPPTRVILVPRRSRRDETAGSEGGCSAQSLPRFVIPPLQIRDLQAGLNILFNPKTDV